MKKLGIILGIIIVVALAIGLGVIQTKKVPKEIKIGAILPLTGSSAQLGEWTRNGLKLAEEYINSLPERKEKHIQIIIEDGMGDPKISLGALRKLIEIDKTKIILSVISSVDLTLVPETDKNGILFFSHAAHPKLSGISPLVFRHAQTAYQEVKLISSFIPQETKNIALAYMNDDYSIALKDGLIKDLKKQNKNIDIVMFEKDETDFLTIATKILEKKPEFLIIASYGKNSGLLITRLREMGYKGEIIINLGFIVSGAVQSAGESIKGVNRIDFDIDLSQKGYSEINQLFKNKYGYEIPLPSLFFFNSVYLLNQAIENVGYDPLKIAHFLKKIQVFQGMGEKIIITETNDILPALKITKF